MKSYVKSLVSDFNSANNTLTQMVSSVFVIPLVSKLLSLKKILFFEIFNFRNFGQQFLQMWREEQKKIKKILQHVVILEVKGRRLVHVLRIILGVQLTVNAADARISLANGHFPKEMRTLLREKDLERTIVIIKKILLKITYYIVG